MEERVFALALELGGVAEGEAQGLSLCCRMAVEELTGMLKQGVTAKSCGNRFAMAAAQIALADWLDLGRGGQPKRFTAGDISVEEMQLDPSGLRRQAMRRMAGSLNDPGVAIRGVRS